MLRQSITGLIRLYQRYISPHKGYCCAYARYHAAPSCSEQVISIINTHPVHQWWRLIRRQFRQCRLAYFTMRKQKEDRNKKKKERDCYLDCCDPSIACEVIPSPKSCGRIMHKVEDIDIGCCPFDL